jgi:hypothetical protein
MRTPVRGVALILLTETAILAALGGGTRLALLFERTWILMEQRRGRRREEAARGRRILV